MSFYRSLFGCSREGETETFASKVRFNAAKPFEGTEVTLTATAKTFYHFKAWMDGETQVSTGVFFPGRFTRHAWNSGLAALTVGSIFKGVLDIYGTTNKLIAVYPAAAAVLISAAVISCSMSYAAIRKMRRETETSSI